jgi:hypothetical protein
MEEFGSGQALNRTVTVCAELNPVTPSKVATLVGELVEVAVPVQVPLRLKLSMAPAETAL